MLNHNIDIFTIERNKQYHFSQFIKQKYLLKAIVMNKLLIFFTLFFIVSFSKIHAQGSAILSYDKDVNYDGKKKKTTYSYVIQVGSKNDHELGDLSIMYSLGENITIHKAAIYDANGNELRKLKKKDFHQRNATLDVSFHDDTYESYASLKTNVYPHLLHFSYTITSNNFQYLANWQPKLYTSIPTLKSSMSLTFPSEVPIRINAPAIYSFQESELEETKTLTWSIDKDLKYTKEEKLPGFNTMFPSVMVVTETIDYGEKLKVNNWQDYGNWVNLLNQGLDDLTEKEILKIHALTDHLKSKNEKVKVLYNYLQDYTRYINVSLGIGGMKPHPASYVCENKYGDCKALTNYMHAMLNEIGIPSYFVDVYAGGTPNEIDISFPSQQFNHVILGVVIETDTIFLENTSKITPYNYLGSSTQNRKGLWVEKDKSQLIDLPILSKENTKDSIAYTFVTEDEISKVHISVQAQRGKLFELLNAYSTKSESKLKKVLGEYVIPFDLQSITTVKLTKDDRNTPVINVEIEAEYKKIYRKIGGFSVITPPQIIDTAIEKPENRVNPYWINCVINKVEKFSYPLNDYTKSDVELPGNFHLITSFGEYNECYSMKDGTIYLERNIYIKPNKINLKQYEDFYAFYKAISVRSKKSSIIINKQL